MLGVHGNATPLTASLTILRPPPGDARTCEQGSVNGSGWERFGPTPIQSLSVKPQFNDCLQFHIQNRDPVQSWYAYVVAVGPDYAVHRLWPHPNANADAARLPPGTRADAAGLFYRLNQSGEETLLAFASQGVVDTLALYRNGVKGEPTSQPSSLIERLLRSRYRLRGTPESASTQWGAESVSFEVKGKSH